MANQFQRMPVVVAAMVVLLVTMAAQANAARPAPAPYMRGYEPAPAPEYSGGPSYAPEYAPSGAPTYSPEYSPMSAPVVAGPAYAPGPSSYEGPSPAYAPGPMSGA